MKLLLTLTLLGLALGGSSVIAQEKKPAAKPHEHEEHAHAKAGPNGGRLITSVEPHVEFLVTKEKKVEIRFVDEANKVVAPGSQQVAVTLGSRAKPTKLAFTKAGDKLVSDKAVPDGNNHPTVVQIRAKAGDKPVNERFNLNMSACPTCKYAEYACTCEHDHEGHEHEKDSKGTKRSPNP